jgi:hypothetical protein
MNVRWFRLFLLVTALLSGQVGGLFHAIGHHAQEGDAPHAACEWCAAYSALDHGLAGAPADIPAAAAPALLPVLVPVSRSGRPFLPFHSRAPPVPV